MPPKKGNQPSARTELKKKQKVVEDKTFGLKNKNRSAKVQKYINDLEKQTVGNQKEMLQKQKEAEARKAAKKAAQEEQRQLDMLLKAAQALEQKKKDEMKKQICPFFVKGKCPKGDDCKLSHDWGDTRKVQKLDLYKDPREGTENMPLENDITCMYFLDVVEKNQYGHFWKCPNGGEKCHYLHRLPKGYVLEEKKDEEEVVDEMTLEEKIEKEREELLQSGKELTPVTPDTLAAWRKKKEEEREKKIEEERLAAEKKMGNRGIGVLSGRALFSFDPSLFVDDADAADAEEVEIREDGFHDDEKKDSKSSDVKKVHDPSLFVDDDLPDSDIE